MKDVIAITSTIYALATFLWVYTLRYRQSRAGSTIAVAPTLPYVFAISLFITFAVWGFDFGLPYWAYPVIFIAALFSTGYLMLKAPAYNLNTRRVGHARPRGIKPGAGPKLRLVTVRTRER